MDTNGQIVSENGQMEKWTNGEMEKWKTSQSVFNVIVRTSAGVKGL